MLGMKKFLSIIAILMFLFAQGGCGGGDGGGQGDDPVDPRSQLAEVSSKVVLQSDNHPGAPALWKQIEGPEVVLSDAASVNPYFRPQEEGRYRFSLMDAGREVDSVIVVAYIPSLVSILHPSSYSPTVNEAALDLRGLASSRIKSVRCENRTTNKTYSGIINEDGTFIVSGIELAGGDNSLEVTAIDDLEMESKADVMVTYNPSIEFIKRLTATPEGIRVNTPTDVLFSLEIYENNERFVPEKFDLYEVDESGNNIEKRGELVKSETEEGVYGANISLHHVSAGMRYYRAVCEEEGVQKSAISKLIVLRDFSEIEVEEAESTIANALESMPKSGDSFDEFLFDTYIEELLETLSGTPSVKNAEISKDGRSIDVEFSSGIKRGIVFHVIQIDDSDSASVRHNTGTPFSSIANERELVGPPHQLAVLSPFEAQFGRYDSWNAIKPLIQSNVNPSFSTRTQLRNTEVTMDSYRDNLKDCSIIIISTHGGKGALLSGVLRNGNGSEKDQKDAEFKRLEPVTSKVIVKDLFGWRFEESKSTYKLFPSFFDHYLSGLNNSVVFLYACSSLEDDSLWNAFSNKGAGGMVGFSETVKSKYNAEKGASFFENLLRGETIRDAFRSAGDDGIFRLRTNNENLRIPKREQSPVPIGALYAGSRGSYHHKSSGKTYPFVSGRMTINLLETRENRDFFSVDTHGKINFQEGAWMQLRRKLQFYKERTGNFDGYRPLHKWTTNHLEWYHNDIRTRANVTIEQKGENEIELTVEHQYAIIRVTLSRTFATSLTDEADNHLKEDKRVSVSECSEQK